MRNTYIDSEMRFKYTTLILNNQQPYEKAEQFIKTVNNTCKISLMTVKKGFLCVMRHDKVVNGQKDD